MAIGLEKSGQRFQWVVRSPRCNPEDVLGPSLPEPDLKALLPEGFLDRTKMKLGVEMNVYDEEMVKAKEVETNVKWVMESQGGISMVLLEPPVKSTASGASFVESLAASNPSVTFHVLPPIPPPDFASSTKHPFLLLQELLGQYNDKLESFLRSTPRERLHSLVIDMFCTDAIDVSAKVGVPVYTFFAANAGALAVLTQTAALLAGRQTGLKELGDTPIEFLGVPPMPASHIIREMLEDPEDEVCKTMAEIWKRDTTDTRGVLVNTFDSLEGRALQAFRDPLCVPGKVLPPVYSIGPLVGTGGTKREEAEKRHDTGFIKAEEIETKVRLVLESEEGIRTRAAELKKEAHAALEDGGSSQAAFLQFLSDVKNFSE
ncbi:unnamed protein product [Miscanthus lutarioriparius]|uniref:Uncharacterized protein n=1 Tax=Miscanthus lutarioriparius TaxID=422564 RepID=A0A811P032_9POAL|nr:unnamed protein product [Miscanthus lutarioriparius]